MSIYKPGTKEFNDSQEIGEALANVPDTRPRVVPGDNYEDPPFSVESVLRVSNVIAGLDKGMH